MFTSESLLAATHGRVVHGPLPASFLGAATDSRQVRPGDLFVALRGEVMDGHHFIPAAAASGASAILCAQADTSVTTPQVVVADPLAAFHALARAHVAGMSARIIAVAGSNGKTSTKEAIAHLLEKLGPTHRTIGNLNTETGVPICLLQIEPWHRFAVIEMGAQRTGEVALLCTIAPPSIGVVTVVGPEHLEFFGDMAHIIEAEGEVIDALAPEALAVLNADDPDVRAMRARHQGPTLLYGRDPRADVRALRPGGDTLSGRSFTLRIGKESARVRLRLPGEHAISTALAAATVAHRCGMSVPRIARALGELCPASRRGEVKRGVTGFTLVDDSYNANRQSAEAAIQTLAGARLRSGGRRWFVFGDMLELGAHSPVEHAGVGAVAAQAHLDELVLVGEDTAHTADAALAAGMPARDVRYFAARRADAAAMTTARQAAAAYVCERAGPADVVLVKGSLGTGMGAVVAALTGEAEADH
ncbi:MAG TPA: UDP-N-acetylmuramoyl-tripeptide--D-alanyl-D-alanine ligase [Ktedonobacterales bacterium]